MNRDLQTFEFYILIEYSEYGVTISLASFVQSDHVVKINRSQIFWPYDFW